MVTGLILYKNKWLCSYSTLIFDTPDGDLDFGQFALTENKKGYYIRTKPKNEAQFEIVDLKYDVSKLKEVKILSGHAYYDEFLTAVGATILWAVGSIHAGKDPSQLPSGSVFRIQSTAEKYDSLRIVKGAPQPSRTETVDIKPPPEPLPEEPTHHSIALDSTSTSGLKTVASSITWSHTCSGDNRILVVGAGHVNDPGRTISGVTYNADAMTKVRNDVSYDGLPQTSVYYQLAPDTGGSYSIVVTFSAAPDASCAGAASFTGVKQSAQPDANNGTDQTSVSVTTVVNNSWIFSTVCVQVEAATTLTSGQTAIYSTAYGTFCYFGSSYFGPQTPAGAKTMSWSVAPYSGYGAISAMSFSTESQPPVKPTVTTQAATNVKATTATGNGTITNTGGEEPSSRGVEWGTSTGSYGTYVTGAGSPFTASLINLPTGTIIYCRAKAYNSAGWGYGDEVTFTTLKPAGGSNITKLVAAGLI